MEGWDIVLLPEQQSKIFSQKKEKKRDGKQSRDTDCISNFPCHFKQLQCLPKIRIVTEHFNIWGHFLQQNCLAFPCILWDTEKGHWYYL